MKSGKAGYSRYVGLLKDKDAEVKIHFDSCDAFCRMNPDMGSLGIGLASFSIHKI